MTATLRHFTSPHDGTRIEWLYVAPLDGVERVGTVQIAHGMSEHKERYIPFMEYLASRGYACAINDHRGHGGSVTSKENLGSFGKDGGKGVIQDALAFTNEVKSFPELWSDGEPYFLFGHSMGALVVRAYVKRSDSGLAGIVVCGSPSENPALGAGKLLAKFISSTNGSEYRSPLLQGLVTGAFNKRYKNEGSLNAWISKNADNYKSYDNDPLCGFPFAVNGYQALFDIMGECYSDWSTNNSSLPILFMSGEDDPCMGSPRNLEAAATRMRRNGYANVEVRLYPGMRHEVLNETGADKVFRDVADTLDEWRK